MRTVSGAYDSAVSSDGIRPVLLLQLDLDGGPIRWNNSSIDLEWPTDTWWFGALGLGGVSNSKETLTGEVPGIVVELNHVPSSMISMLLLEHVQGRRGTLYYGQLDSTFNLIADPVIEFRGLCDRLVGLDGPSGKIQLPIESRMMGFKRGNTARWNSVSHRETSQHANDTFFDHVENMVDKTLVWPNKNFFKR